MRTITLIACLLLLGFIPAVAQTQPAAQPGPVWVSLFNGKDLTGWKVVGKARWFVEDGAIISESVEKRGGFIKTEKTYKDFDASLRFKCDTPVNSGFFYHSDIEEDLSNVKYVQVEIDARIGAHTGGLHGDRSTPTNDRGFFVWPAPENEAVLRPFEWNEMLVQVHGNRIRTRLNGVRMIDFTDPKPNNVDGIIALQMHNGANARIRFKDLWIRDLTVR